MINPTIVEGQIAGGVVQGIGGVLLEHFVYDEHGQPAHDHVHGLPAPDRGRGARDRVRPHRDAGVDARGLQGRRGGRRDRRARRGGQRGERRARARRRPRVGAHRSRRRASSKRSPRSVADDGSSADCRAAGSGIRSDEQHLADDGGIGSLKRGIRRGRHRRSRKPTMQSTRLADSKASGSTGRRRAGGARGWRRLHGQLHGLREPVRAQRFVDIGEAAAVAPRTRWPSAKRLGRCLNASPPCWEMDATKRVSLLSSSSLCSRTTTIWHSSQPRRSDGTSSRQRVRRGVRAGAGADTRRSPRRASPSNRSGRGPPSCCRSRSQRRSAASTHRRRRDRRSVVLRRAGSLLGGLRRRRHRWISSGSSSAVK